MYELDIQSRNIPFFRKENEPELSPVNTWLVETEADVSGNGKKISLGYFKGHVAEIAFKLANRCLETLTFTAAITKKALDIELVIEPERPFGVQYTEIPIRVTGAPNNVVISDKELWYEKFLDTNAVRVCECGGIYTGCVKLIRI